MALFEEDGEGDLMVVLEPDVDTLFEVDAEGDVMPRVEPLLHTDPDTTQVKKGVVYGFEDDPKVGELGIVDFESIPQAEEE
jgi:hypothetical protein